MCLEEKGGEGSSAPLLANPVQLNQYKSKDKAASFNPPPPPCSHFFSPLLAFLILPPSPHLRILLLLFISSPLSQLLPVPTCRRGLGSSWRSNSWQRPSIGHAESSRARRHRSGMRKKWVGLGISTGAACSLGSSGYQAAGKSLIYSTMSTWSHPEPPLRPAYGYTQGTESSCAQGSDGTGTAQLAQGGKCPMAHIIL